MTVYHHRSAQIVSDRILYSWRNQNQWMNPFVSNNTQAIASPNNFPSPDAFHQLKTIILMSSGKNATISLKR